MPLDDKHRQTIIQLAREYGVKKIWLFGSMLHPQPGIEPRDIDLAVEGVPKGSFFDFYARLIDLLPLNVDLIPMDGTQPMAILVRKNGEVIYG